MEDSDPELISRLARGDLNALEVLYARYTRPVYSLAARMLADVIEAEEVTQDVFERIWRGAASFDRARGRVGTWVMSLTYHQAIDVLRKRRRRPPTYGGTEGEIALKLIPDTRIDIAAETVGSMDGVQVRQALTTLPEAQRRAIELAYYGGLSQMEIAAALNEPLGTVKARIRRGMERLRVALEESGVDVQDT